MNLFNEYGQPLPDWVKPKGQLKRIGDKELVALREPFPDEAIDEMDFGAHLTTIKAMYVVERLNKVFGVGRWIHHHTIISTDKKQVIAKGRLELLDYDVVIPEQYGGSKGEGADAYKGAVTNSLSKCASYLEIGIDVFKGKRKKNKKPIRSAPDYLTQLKARIAKDHPELKELDPAEAEKKALELLNLRTGLKCTSFKTMAPKQAQMALTAYLNPKNNG